MISLLYPINASLPKRLGLFKNTISSILHHARHLVSQFEVIVLTNNSNEILKKYILDVQPSLDITYVHYRYPGLSGYHNPAYAFNLGCNLAKYDSIVLTSPEIKHQTPVIPQLLELVGQNILCRVVEVDINGKHVQTLMGTDVPARVNDPGMYFIGMYNKTDYITVGGIDEDFMQGLGWEDRDFGRRFGSKFEFQTLDSIQGIHQPHPRPNQNSEAFQKNRLTLKQSANANKIVANTKIIMGNPDYIRDKV